MGWDKTAPVAALQQANFDLPLQAAAAAVHKQTTFQITLRIKKNLVCCGTSCTAAAPQ